MLSQGPAPVAGAEEGGGVKTLPSCPRCGAPSPETPIITRMIMGGGVYFLCPGCQNERVIPWGVCDLETIERGRKVVE